MAQTSPTLPIFNFVSSEAIWRLAAAPAPADGGIPAGTSPFRRRGGAASLICHDEVVLIGDPELPYCQQLGNYFSALRLFFCRLRSFGSEFAFT